MPYYIGLEYRRTGAHLPTNEIGKPLFNRPFAATYSDLSQAKQKLVLFQKQFPKESFKILDYNSNVNA